MKMEEKASRFWTRKISCLLHQERSSDCVIRINRDQHIYCHRIILAAHSPVFYEQLYPVESPAEGKVGNYDKHGRIILDIDHMGQTVESVLAFLGYLYAGQSIIKDEFLINVYELAIAYDVEMLKSCCEEQLTSNLTPTKSLFLFGYIIKLEKKELKSSEQSLLNEKLDVAESDSESEIQVSWRTLSIRAQSEIEEHFCHISDLDCWIGQPLDVVLRILTWNGLQASEDQVFDASLDWLEADMIRRAEENNALHTLQISANQLLEHIRFPCLSSTKLKHLSRLFDNAPSLSSSSASTLENTTKPISQIEVEDLLKGVPDLLQRVEDAFDWQLWLQKANMADLPNQSNSLDDFGDEENEQLHEGEELDLPLDFESAYLQLTCRLAGPTPNKYYVRGEGLPLLLRKVCWDQRERTDGRNSRTVVIKDVMSTQDTVSFHGPMQWHHATLANHPIKSELSSTSCMSYVFRVIVINGVLQFGLLNPRQANTLHIGGTGFDSDDPGRNGWGFLWSTRARKSSGRSTFHLPAQTPDSRHVPGRMLSLLLTPEKRVGYLFSKKTKYLTIPQTGDVVMMFVDYFWNRGTCNLSFAVNTSKRLEAVCGIRIPNQHLLPRGRVQRPPAACLLTPVVTGFGQGSMIQICDSSTYDLPPAMIAANDHIPNDVKPPRISIDATTATDTFPQSTTDIGNEIPADHSRDSKFSENKLSNFKEVKKCNECGIEQISVICPCHKAHYCGQVCKKKDWSRHKKKHKKIMKRLKKASN